MITVETDTSQTLESYRFKTEFVYDGRQRLRVRKEWVWQYGGWYGPMSETRYVYDGMLVIQERNSSNVPLISYTRGLDLSGTLAGAGGIGGLLARSRHATSSPYAVNGNSFYHADGNGNVTYLANSSGGTDAAYRYDPFGRWLAQTGPYASANVMRFSSKPWVAHNGSNTDGLYYYGYRFYDPLTQRWLNRDPIGENGGFNLYGFVGNNPNFYIDALGLFVTAPRPIIIEIPPGLSPGTTMPRLYPPIPIIPPQNSDPSASPGNQPTPDDGLPPLNKPWNAPKVCPRTCPPERLKELSDNVNYWKKKREAYGMEMWCKKGDDYYTILDKMRIIQEEINARTRRERECWGGGNKSHVLWIEEMKKQLEECRRLLPSAPVVI